MAAKVGNVAMAHSFLARGLDVHDKNRSGNTALYLAASYIGRGKMVSALLAAGANVHELNNKGEYAARAPADVIAILQSAGKQEE